MSLKVTFKGYKTVTSQNVSYEAQVKNFLPRRKVMFRSQDIQVFVLLTINYLRNLWIHDEYWYIRQGTFLNISLEPQHTYNEIKLSAIDQ